MNSVREADGGIKPGVEGSGTPGNQPEIAVSPRSGRQPCDSISSGEYVSTINNRFLIGYRPLRGLAAIFHPRSWGLRLRLYATVRSADC